MAAYVRLRVAAEAYALPVAHVLEVSDLGEVVAVPGAPPELLGVRNLRGRLLPVVDLARLIGIPRTAPGRQLLVTEAGGQQAGLVIDEVSEVGEMPDPAEETESRLLLGGVLTGGDLVGVVDVPAVFRVLAQEQR